MRAIILLLSSMLLLAGCATIPQSVSGDNFTQMSADQARTNPEQAKGANVRWGGVIVEVINNETETWIEVLAMPLSNTSKPLSDRQSSQGRFIAKTPDFLDPEIYQKGLRITFVGTIDSTLEGKVGERSYVYPILAVKAHHLWPRRIEQRQRFIAPGFWYYGFHPYWRFGYPFYGYGVWHYNVSYPYYPVYGYLNRSNTRLPRNRLSGDFSFARSLQWPHSSIIQYRTNQYRTNGYRHRSPYNVNQRQDRRTQRAKPNTNSARNNRAASTRQITHPRQGSPRRSPRQSEK